MASATQNVAQAVQSMQNVLMATQVLSSVVIVGTIVVQTQHEQNLVFYMDKIGDYMGYVKYARSLQENRTLAAEIRDMASPPLAGAFWLQAQPLQYCRRRENQRWHSRFCGAVPRSMNRPGPLLMNQFHRAVDKGGLGQMGEQVFLEYKPKLLELMQSPSPDAVV